MKKVIIFLSFISSLAVGTANATNNKTVYQIATLKNGTLLYGFIQQNDGLGTLTFHSDSAIVYLENVEADCSDRLVPKAQVMEQWREWADRNHAWQGANGSEGLLLSDISVRSVQVKDSVRSMQTKGDNFINQLKGKQFTNVRVLERGVKYKYIELTPNSYSLKWADIVNISSERRPSTILSGIITTCQTKNGPYEGQYAGETVSTTSLYLASGVIQTLAKKDVQKYSYRALNPNQSIFEQSRLLDVVNVKNSSSVSGIIIEQNYASGKDTENYILIQQESGIIQSVKMSDITTISKEYNSKYAPKQDIILTAGEVYVNGGKATPTKVISKKGLNTLEKFTPIVLKKGANDLTKVEVQYSASAIGQNVEAFRVVPLRQAGKGKSTTYSFSDEALIESVYRPSEISTSVNQTTTAVYNLNGKGGFLIYDAKAKVGYCVFVEP